MIRLPRDFKEFFECFHQEKVEYLVVGGYAVNVHGYSRATGDIDVWIATDLANLEAVCRALARFGFGGGVRPEMFQGESWVFQIGVEPLRIDLLTKVTGLDFPDAFSRKTVVSLDGQQINFLSLDDLRINKRATGRNKDLGDLDYLGPP